MGAASGEATGARCANHHVKGRVRRRLLLRGRDKRWSATRVADEVAYVHAGRGEGLVEFLGTFKVFAQLPHRHSVRGDGLFIEVSHAGADPGVAGEGVE